MSVEFIIKVIALVANSVAIVLIVEAFYNFRSKNYAKAITQLMFCIALSSLFQVHIS